jgi:hypothetical protein
MYAAERRSVKRRENKLRSTTRAVLLLIALGASAAARSTVPLLVAEACAALPEIEQRLKCLRQAATPAIEKASAAAPAVRLEQQFLELVGTVESGTVNYRAYSDMVRELSKSIALYSEAAGSDLEKKAARQADKMLQALNDAASVWDADIRQGAKERGYSQMFPLLVLRQYGLEHLIEQYDIPAKKISIFSNELGVHPRDAFRWVFLEAQNRGEEMRRAIKAAAR